MRRSRRISALIRTVAALAAAGGLLLAVGWERAGADTYTVQEGDTLWGIANHFQIRVSVLLALNDEISSADSIYVGQEIQVPDNALAGSGSPSGGSPTAEGGTIVYAIQPGDTLSAIAVAYETTVDAILALNPEIDPRALWVGTEITVPRGGGAVSTQSSESTQPDSGNQDSGQRTLHAGNPSAASSGMTTREYVVQSGDSLYGIAEQAGITIQVLREYNPQLTGDVIHPGEVIYIPTPDYHAPAIDPEEAGQTLTTQYTVRAGDNASTIAERFGISLSELVALNFGADLSQIYIGQTLIVPWTQAAQFAAAGTVPAVEQRRRSYQVQAGDTFSAIAERHGLSLEELRELNPMRSTDLLIIGQLLYLPGFVDLPTVAEERTLSGSDLVQYAAAELGVTPHTLVANHGWLEPGQWLDGGTTWRLPIREGLLVTVQRGDTLQGIAAQYGVTMEAILADPAHGVEDPNEIVIGQEIILPLQTPDFVWPATGTLTDPFGLCRSQDCSYRHKGLDIALDQYEPILASAAGVVSFVGGDSHAGLGWYIEIDHGNGWSSVYAHLVEFAVWQGQEVSAGELIGYNGNTGYSTGPHLHFEIRHDDWYVDPLVLLP